MDGGKRRVDSRCMDGNNNMIIDHLMLRFRPIAPRPVTAERSGNVLPEKDVNWKRVKRKYVRVKKKKKMINDGNNKNWFDLDRTVAMIEDANGTEVSVTDPLQKVTNWISFDTTGNKGVMNNNDLFICKPSPLDLHGVDLATAVSNRKVVESWITVESVTGACEDQKLLGYSDEEIWKNLETDSCPGFISKGYNGYDKVQWVNPAYRRMLNVKEATEVAVWLVVKVDKLAVENFLPAFSCRVRIEYLSSEKKTPLTVPCDVCKMNSGEFAWRLDVKFALSLGPLIS